MAFEKNDLKGILILVLYAIPMVASTNINCSGRAFHCVNSTHFMICVDLGGGVSSTIDDFVIPCPATTVCHENNIFECDFPEVVTPPPLQVIGVYKQSDTSEPTTVTNSVTPTSDIFSVFKQNVIATTLSIPEDVTPVVKLEVLEDIKGPAGANNGNTTETSLKVPSSFIDRGNEIVNDKQASNKTITTSATDNYNNLEPVVETSILKTVNTSSKDNSKSIDMVTSVIGLINLISTDPASVASNETSSDVLTPLDSLYGSLAITTDQYITKEVTTHGDKVNYVTDKLNISTQNVITESSIIPDVVGTTPVVNTYNKNNTIEYVNETEFTHQNIAEKNNFSKSNGTSELVPKTKTASVQIVNIFEPVTVAATSKTTTDDTYVPLGVVGLISADSKVSVSSTNGYINTFDSDAATTTTDQYTTNLETTLSEKPVTTEVISTNSVINAVVHDVSKTEMSNNAFTIAAFMTVPSLRTTTEKNFVPMTSEANIVNTTDTVTKSEVLFNNDSLTENQSIAIQPLDREIGTKSSTIVTDNLYTINEELNVTFKAKNTTIDTIKTTEKDSTQFNVSSTQIINEKSTEPTLTLPTATPYPPIEITTAEILLNAFSPSAFKVTRESPVVNIVSVTNSTLLYKTTDINTTENNKTVFNASSTDITNSKHTELTLSTPYTIKYPTVETSTAETLHNDFKAQAIEAINEKSTTNAPPSVNETNLSTDSVTNTADLLSQSDIVTDPINLTVNLGSILNQENLNTEKTVQDIVNQTTTYWSAFEKSVSSPVLSVVTENTNLSHIDKLFKQDTIPATGVVKTQDVLKSKPHEAPLTVSYVPELSITTHKTVQTTPRSIDTTVTFEQVSTYTPELVDVYRASTSGNKIEASTTFPLDVTHLMGMLPATHTTHAEYVTAVPITTLQTQESISQLIGTVKQLNTTNSPSDLISTTFTTARYNAHNTTDMNTSNWKDSVNTNTVSSKVDPNVDGNETKTVNTIESKNNDSASSAIYDKVESIKTVVVLDIVNSSGNVRPTGSTEPSSTNPSLSNDSIKTTAAHDSDAYATTAYNVPDNILVQVGELVSHKNPEVTVPLAETKIISSVSSTLTTLPIIEISAKNIKYVGTEAPIPSTVDFKHTDPTKSVVDYVTEKTNDYVSTDVDDMISHLNKLPIVLAETSPSLVRSVTLDTVVTPVDSLPVYDEVTTIKNSTFSVSSTVTTDSNINTSTESPLLTSKFTELEIGKYNTESSLVTSEVPVAQITTEPTNANKVYSQTERVAVTSETNQDILTEINTTDLPQSILQTINHNTHQPLPGVTTAQTTIEPIHTANFVAQTAPVVAVGTTNEDVVTGIKTTKPHNILSTVRSTIPLSTSTLPIVRVTAEQIVTTEPTHTINTFEKTTPLVSNDKTNQDVLNGIRNIELPQYVISTLNNNTPLSMPELPAVRVIADQITTEPAHTTNTLASTTPLLATGETNQDVLTEIKTIEVPQYVTIVQNNSPQSMPSIAIAEVTVPQITTEPTLIIVFGQTTPPLASAGKTNSLGIKTTDLPQYVTSTVTSNNSQSISDTTTETIIDSLTAPDSMVETINITGDKISETYVRDTISSDVKKQANNPTGNNVKTVKNFIDHESIVIGSTSKNLKSLDMSKAEIVNHTESNWTGSDVNIDGVKIKKSEKEEDEGKEKKEDSKSAATKSGTDVQNKTLDSDFAIIPKIEPKDDKPVDKIEHKLIRITKNYSGFESGVSKNISDSYNKNNTNSNITSSLHNLSHQNSTINEELEQHLLSPNHTIATDVQSHLNESDKQSNKTSDELTLNVAGMHNLNTTSSKFYTSGNATRSNTVPASIFNCTNHTRGKYADKKDCRKFYTCIGNLQPLLGTCPNNTVFSEINKQCTKNLSHCVRNNQFRCLFEGRFSDFFKDNIYYICVKNRLHGFIRYKLQCQDDYHLNKDKVKCEKNEETSIQSASSVSETNTDESKPKPKSEKIVSIDDFECENEGKFPYAKDCNKYYVCTKVKNVYRRKIKKCASDEVFHKNKKKCVESDSGEC